MVTKRCHVVPARLQLNWGQDFWVYDKIRDEKFPANSQAVMINKRFYIPKVEDTLAIIEGMCNPIIKKILETKTLTNLTQDDYYVLSAYIHTMFSRTYMIRNQFGNMSSQIENHIEKMGFDPKKTKGFTPLTEKDIENMSYEFLFDMDVAFSVWPNKKWVLVEAKKNYPFWLGDNPVTLHNVFDMGPYGNIGLKVFGVELYLPLSPKYALVLKCPMEFDNMKKQLKAIPDAIRLTKQHRAAAAISNKKMVRQFNSNIKDFLKAKTSLEKQIDKIETKQYTRFNAKSVLFFNHLQYKYATRNVIDSTGEFRNLDCYQGKTNIPDIVYTDKDRQKAKETYKIQDILINEDDTKKIQSLLR